MKWVDRAVVIQTKRLGEDKLVATVMTETYGRHAGVVRVSKKNGQAPQVGDVVHATWSARLSEHLGSWAFETLYTPLPHLMGMPIKLEALTAICAILSSTQAEREPQPLLYHHLMAFVMALEGAAWGMPLLSLQGALIADAGIQLDFTRCGATGVTTDLVYLSPRTGRAICREAGAPFAEKLLALPGCLAVPSESCGVMGAQDLLDAVTVMDYFLERYVLAPHGLALPEACARLRRRLEQHNNRAKAA